MKKTFLLNMLCSSILLMACSDDSSSPTKTDTTEATSLSSSSIKDNEQSSSSEKEISEGHSFPLDDFTDIGEVFKSVRENEKVVFVIRHAERSPKINKESPLTEDGELDAQEVGKKLISKDEFVYVHSDYTRTYQTCENIAIGRNETNFKSDTISTLGEKWFVADTVKFREYISQDSIKNVNEAYAAWVYEGKYTEAFYDLKERSLELIDNYILEKSYADMPKYKIVASHDQVLMPIVVYISEKKIDLKLHDIDSRKWLNYLAGFAIIVNDKNERTYVPIKGMDKGSN